MNKTDLGEDENKVVGRVEARFGGQRGPAGGQQGPENLSNP